MIISPSSTVGMFVDIRNPHRSEEGKHPSARWHLSSPSSYQNENQKPNHFTTCKEISQQEVFQHPPSIYSNPAQNGMLATASFHSFMNGAFPYKEHDFAKFSKPSRFAPSPLGNSYGMVPLLPCRGLCASTNARQLKQQTINAYYHHNNPTAHNSDEIRVKGLPSIHSSFEGNGIAKSFHPNEAPVPRAEPSRLLSNKLITVPTPESQRPIATSMVNGKKMEAGNGNQPCKIPGKKNRVSRSAMRIKTEPCKFFSTGNECPYGDRCTYAHGEHEIRRLRFGDLKAMRLTDIWAYRTKPCFMHVSTGTCPFDLKCASIHDPRIQIDTETIFLKENDQQPSRILKQTVTIDCRHRITLSSILHNNPFGILLKHDAAKPSADRKTKEWNEFYNKVCGVSPITDAKGGTMDDFKFVSEAVVEDGTTIIRLSEKQRLEIVISMIKAERKIGRNSGHDTTYFPTHILHGEECMIQQTAAFNVTKTQAKTIPMVAYDAKNEDHVLVQEIVLDPSATECPYNSAYCFGIPAKNISQVTTHPSKEKKEPNQAHEEKERFPLAKKKSHLQARPFLLIRPLDDDAQELTHAILDHRFRVLEHDDLKKGIHYFQARRNLIDALEVEELVLRHRFESIQCHWDRMHPFPFNHQWAYVDDDTLSPPNGESYNVKGEQHLWDTFVSMIEKDD